MIKLLNRRPQVAGYLKIGVVVDGRRKDGSTYTRPSKLDHIEVTGTARDGADSLVPELDLMRVLIERMVAAGVDPMLCGGCPRAVALGFPHGLPRRLPIYLPHGELDRVFPNRLALYKSRTAECHGDGESAQRLMPVRGGKGELAYQDYGPCGEACPDFAGGKCKPNGKLYLCISGAPRVGAVYAFHTTSWGSISNIIDGLSSIADIAGTIEALPLFFDLQQRTVTPQRGGVGNASTAWIASVYFPGTERDLLKIAGEELAAIGAGRARVREIAAQIAAGAWIESPEDAARVEREFYAPRDVSADVEDGPSFPSSTQAASLGAPSTSGDVIDIEPVAGPQPTRAESSEAGVPSCGPTTQRRARERSAGKPVESEGAAEEAITNEDVTASTVGVPVAVPSGTSEPGPFDATQEEIDAARIGDAERVEIVNLFRAANLTVPRDCLKRASLICGREIKSTKDLTFGEFRDVTDHLRSAAKRVAGARPHTQESML